MGVAINQDRGPIPKEALEYFTKKKLKVGMDYRDVWREEHAIAFTIAGEMKLDILETVKQGITRSLEDGTTFAQFKKELAPALQSAGWTGVGKAKPTRLELVYDTNVRQARSAGQWERIERTKVAIPFLVYELGPSERHRPHHAAWEGTLLPAEDPWWDSHMPSNGHRCKCHVEQITEFRMEKLGGVTERPSSRKVPWKNERTGKVEKVPIGIDPGFDYNPGKVRYPETQ